MKIAIITGASSGLGLEFAKQIDSKRNVDEIWLVSRNEEKLNQVAHTLSTPSIAVPADLSKTADIATIADKIAEENMTIRYLVNSAGFGKFGSWNEVSEDDAEAMIDLNCKGLVSMTRACLPHMTSGSKIIQVASAAGFIPLPYMNVYAATKAFVLHYTRALRWELHGTGITATALCPTWVKTKFTEVAKKDASASAVSNFSFAQTPEAVVSKALRDNEAHFAVSCAGALSLGIRFATKIVPDCISMAVWNAIR